MSESFEFRSLLVCDEIRQEVGGKQLIIGAYAGVIVLPFLPYVGRLTLRFEVKAHRNFYQSVACTVFNPDKSVFFHEDTPYPVQYPQYPLSFYFTDMFPNFPSEGEYSVHLKMDSDPRPVGSFEIISSANVPKPPSM